MTKILRKILIFSFIVAALVALHFIDFPKIVISEKEHIPYGSYGVPFSTMPAKVKPRVILLGNSVLQYTDVVSYIVDIKEKTGADFEIGNFGVTGASIADYIITYNYIKQFQPDLIVVHLAPITFGYNEPLYRNESMKLIWQPKMRALWQPEFLSTYSKEELAQSVLYSYFPIIQRWHILRTNLKGHINAFTYNNFKFNVMNFYPYDLNLGKEWHRTAYRPPNVEQYAQTEDLMRFFVAQLKKDNQKTLFVVQETNDDDSQMPIFEKIPTMLGDDSLFRFYNFRGYYREDEYDDSIHPNKTVGAPKQAMRLFKIIVLALMGK